MTDRLANSRRVLPKVTYTPLVLPDAAAGAALQLAGLADTMALLPGEATAAAQDIDDLPQDANAPAMRALEALAVATDPEARLGAARSLATQPSTALRSAFDAVIAGRQRAVDAAVPAIETLTRAYLDAVAPDDNDRCDGKSGALIERLGTLERRLDALTASAVAESADRDTASSGASVLHRAAALAPPSSATAAASADAARAALPAVLQARLSSDVAAHAIDAVRWAQASRPQLLQPLTSAVQAVLPAALRRDPMVLMNGGFDFLAKQVQQGKAAAALLTQRNLQPIGLLHLERLQITPLEVERGELVYSLPLAPHEKVTLAHKEWSLREEEYARFVQDYFQDYSEHGVAEKGDMAVVTRSDTEHSKTLSMSKVMVPGAATVAEPVETQAAVDVTSDKQSQQQSRADSRETTRRASSLAVRDQKQSFTVTTVSGSEDFTAQLFENPSNDQVMLVEYFRRMRKWRNRLYRTGIRLTYDVVLPDPGRRLRERWEEVTSIDAQLAQSFALAVSPPSLRRSGASMHVAAASFGGVLAGGSAASIYGDPRSPLEQDVDYFRRLAATYDASVPPPPELTRTIEQVQALKEPGGPQAGVLTVSLPVPDTHEVARLWIGGRLVPAPNVAVRGEFRNQRLDFDPNSGIFQSKELTIGAQVPAHPVVAFITEGGPVGLLRVWAEVQPRTAAWQQWLASAASAVRQAAMARYNEQREMLRQRRAAVLKELQAPDTLSLRRMEREQVMHLVLEWLFPDFKQGGQAYADVLAKKPDSWHPAMEYGEYVKFVHRAIDWDHALVMLYPYFWDAPAHHAAKLYLDHADGGHKEFLRAGAARVMLAITPGAEDAVVALLDAGELGGVAASPRYRNVIEQVQATHRRYAELLEGAFETGGGAGDNDGDGEDSDAPPAVADPAAMAGDLIGEWIDYTPTSALDMTTTLRPVVQEP